MLLEGNGQGGWSGYGAVWRLQGYLAIARYPCSRQATRVRAEADLLVVAAGKGGRVALERIHLLLLLLYRSRA